MNRIEIKSSYYPKIPPNSYLQSKFHVTGAIFTMETTSLHFPPNFCTCVTFPSAFASETYDRLRIVSQRVDQNWKCIGVKVKFYHIYTLIRAKK